MAESSATIVTFFGTSFRAPSFGSVAFLTLVVPIGSYRPWLISLPEMTLQSGVELSLLNSMRTESSPPLEVHQWTESSPPGKVSIRRFFSV